jgi:imidazolonepropionase
VYAGNGANEFEKRLQGATYNDIVQAGGGIRATVVTERRAAG